MPIDTLSRDELSERPDLAASKFTGAWLVPAPAERTENTLDRYREVAWAGAAAHADPTTVAHVSTRDDIHVLSREPAVQP